MRQWADGVRTPSGDVLRRLRAAYQVAALLAERDQPAVVQAWFQGIAPQLEDCSSALLLRDGDLDEAGLTGLVLPPGNAATATWVLELAEGDQQRTEVVDGDAIRLCTGGPHDVTDGGYLLAEAVPDMTPFSQLGLLVSGTRIQKPRAVERGTHHLRETRGDS